MKKPESDHVAYICVPIVFCILWGAMYAPGWQKLAIPVIGIYCLVKLLELYDPSE